MKQHRASRRAWLLAVLAVSAALIAIVSIAVNLLLDAPLDVLVRDPMATAGGHPLTGALSHVGVLTWWAAAVVCVFAGFLVRRWGGGSEAAWFLLWAGAISALLALDDLFMFHDDLLWRHTPVPQRAAIAVIVLVVVVFVWRFRRVIAQSEWSLLAVAGALFALSIGVDFVSDRMATAPEVTFVEDWLKLVGILAWATYLISLAATFVEQAARAAAGSRPTDLPR